MSEPHTVHTSRRVTGFGARESAGPRPTAGVMIGAKEIWEERFNAPSSPRSMAYKAGFLAGLKWMLGECRSKQPYRTGTAAADAWYGGNSDAKIHIQYCAQTMPELNERVSQARSKWRKEDGL
jgi:hypothetical protein